MLNIIRDNIQSFGVKFVVGIVVVVMSFFGISAYQSQSSNTLVTVDGYEVKIDAFQRTLENSREEVRRRYGNQAAEYLKQVNLEAQVVQQLTSNALLLKTASSNSFAVSDRELAYEIYHNPAFMTDDRFDPAKYDNNLNNLRIDKIAYEKQLKESLLSQKFLKFVSTGPLFSRKTLEEEYRRFESELTMKVIELDPALFSGKVEVSNKDIEDYYESHKSDFQQKTQFKLNYFVINTKDVEDKINVREKEISRYYELNAADEFTDKASYLARHILVSIPQDRNPEAIAKAKLKIDSIYQQLQKNPDQFPALAKTYSDDPGSAKNGGKLGWVEQGSFVGEFEAVVENLGKNQISEPFLTNFGYHIVQVLDKKAAKKRSFAEVKGEIEQEIRTNKAKRRLSNTVDKLLQNSADKSLEDLAKSMDLPVSQTVEFDDTKELENIGNAYQLYQELNRMSQNQKGQYALPGDQSIVVYEVADIKEPFIKPLDQVKEQVRYFATEEKKEAMAQEKMNEYASSVKTLSAFDKAATQLGTKTKTVTFKLSEGQVGDLNVGNHFKSEVVKLEKGQIKAIQDANRRFLVYLLERQEGEFDEKSQETLASLENMLQNQKTQVVLNGLINKLQKEIKIDYNEPLLDALNVHLGT